MYLVNHELKTPLTVLNSFLELLAETNLNDEQKKYISQISSSSKKLQRIVEDVLQLISAETGLLPINSQIICLKEVLVQVIAEHVDRARKKSIDFDIHHKEINIQANPRILEKVLSHIVSNAVKFGNSSSTIECGVRPNKNIGEIYISNSGKALEDSIIEKILKPFTMDEDVMNHSSGLGLGLSLCQALLKRHGSKLKIHCPKGKVEVSFQLPLSL